MRLLKKLYEKRTGKPAPYYYNYNLLTVIAKPIRKWLTNVVAANCPFNCIRIFYTVYAVLKSVKMSLSECGAIWMICAMTW